MSYTNEEMVALMIAEVRKLRLWQDAPASVISAHLLDKFGLKRWGEAGDLGVLLAQTQFYVAARQEEEDAADDSAAPENRLEAAITEDDWWWKWKQSDTEESLPVRAGDWTASASPQFALIAPSGNEYKITVHNGVTWDEVVRTIAEAESALDWLITEAGFIIKNRAISVSQPAAPARPAHSTTVPHDYGWPEKHLRGDPPGGPQDTEEGQTVFGVDGLCYPGHEYILMAGRMVADPTQDGGSRVTFVHERSQYDSGVSAFPGKNGATFEHILAATGVDPETLMATHEFSSAIPVVFRLGGKKQRGTGRYLEFVRIDDH